MYMLCPFLMDELKVIIDLCMHSVFLIFRRHNNWWVLAADFCAWRMSKSDTSSWVRCAEGTEIWWNSGQCCASCYLLVWSVVFRCPCY